MCAASPYRHVLRLAELPADRPYEFAVEPDGSVREAIANLMGITRLRRLTLVGRIAPLNDGDWRLEAKLGATVTQNCVVTLVPVVTRIDEPVVRSYVASIIQKAPAEEMEMPADDSIEPLSAELDLGAVLFEELALALPPYPRAEDAEPFEACYAPADVAPLDAAAVKPFAGLAKLKETGNRTGNGHRDS